MPRRRLVVGLGLVALVLTSLTAWAGSDRALTVSANAPPGADELLIQVIGRPNNPLVPLGCPEEGEVRIIKDEIVYQVPGKLEFENCRGSLAVPTEVFVRRNGQHLVEVITDAGRGEDRVDIRKVVNYVWPRPFLPPNQADIVRVDVALDEILGQPLVSGIITSGTLDLQIWYEGCDRTVPAPLPVEVSLPETEGCPDGAPPEDDVHQVAWQTSLDLEHTPSTTIFVPFQVLEVPNEDRAPEGWYNITAQFHNDEALGNRNIPTDPSMYASDPPLTWFELRWSS